MQEDSPRGGQGSPAGDEDARKAAVAEVAAYLAELDEAAQDDDEDVYNDIISPSSCGSKAPTLVLVTRP